MEISSKTRVQYRIQTAIFIILFIGIIGLLAWLSTQYSMQSDWTAGQRNSLSEDTIRLLSTLDQPVHVRSYQQDENNAGVKDILQRYQQHKPDFDFRTVNPDLEPDLAKADGIREYGQTVIKYRDQQQLIDALDEQSISNALLRLSRTEAPLLAFVSGHGERSINDSSNTGYGLLQQQLRDKGFAFSQINLLSDAIDANVRVLVIAGPDHDFLAGEIEKIQTYVNGGGKLLWLSDPGSNHGLDPLLQQLGLEKIRGVVVDTNPQLRATLRTPHPAVLPVLAYGEHAITAELRYHTLFAMAAAFKSIGSDDWQATPFLLSLPGSSWAETGNFVLDPQLNENAGDSEGPLAIGYALEKSAADNKKFRVVVIGDSDFLANSNLGAGANLLLIQNVFNWLAEDDALINIAPRPAPDLQLNLNQNDMMLIGFGFLLVLPLALAGSGFFIWYQRRKR